jgi:F420H(2)-dependent quinone reductase
MPLNGDYEPSPSERVRRQVELYEATNGAEGGTQHGKPVILLTSQGAKSGKIRKIPLMRIEHNGFYAVVASHAGAPKNPFWYYNLVANPPVELQDGAVKQDMRAREVFGQEKAEWWERADAAYSAFPKSSTSGKAGGLNCEPLKAVWPATPAFSAYSNIFS